MKVNIAGRTNNELSQMTKEKDSSRKGNQNIPADGTGAEDETTNKELRKANEELLSINEKLQLTRYESKRWRRSKAYEIPGRSYGRAPEYEQTQRQGRYRG